MHDVTIYDIMCTKYKHLHKVMCLQTLFFGRYDHFNMVEVVDIEVRVSNEVNTLAI